MESSWCRKEAWFADAMAMHAATRVERATLSEALVEINGLHKQRVQRESAFALEYPIAPRVLRDIDFHGRQPNLFTLNEGGHSTEVFLPVQTLLAAESRPEDDAWIKSLGEAVAAMLDRVTMDAPQGEPRALWSTAAQLAVAAFGLTSRTRSKMAVRAGVDDLNAAIENVAGGPLVNDAVFRRQPRQHLGLIAAASAIAIPGFQLDHRFFRAVQHVVGLAAILHGGVLLLDARERGPLRDFRLRLAATLIQHNLAIGIIQDARDEVHQGRVDELPLEVLPCVTLHPNMEWLLT